MVSDKGTDYQIIKQHAFLSNVKDEMTIMQEEIFGPLLPVKTYSGGLEKAIAMINAGPRPLAAYYFGHTEAGQQKMISNTTSGALVINDVMTHASLDSPPFGGVGASGTGACHGIHGSRRFSHAKPVVIQNQEGTTSLRLRAPYQDKIETLKAFFNV